LQPNNGGWRLGLTSAVAVASGAHFQKPTTPGESMKLTLIAALCLLIAGLAVAAAPAQFAGTWKLDKQKSDALQGPMAGADITLTVAQDDKQLAVETKYSGTDRDVPAQKVTYGLDGAETDHEFAGRMPGKGKVAAKWLGDGKALELRATRTVNFQGEDRTITITEKWELDADGKTLKVARNVDFGQGSMASNLVFNKQ
jgi:surface antigen